MGRGGRSEGKREVREGRGEGRGGEGRGGEGDGQAGAMVGNSNIESMECSGSLPGGRLSVIMGSVRSAKDCKLEQHT